LPPAGEAELVSIPAGSSPPGAPVQAEAADSVIAPVHATPRQPMLIVGIGVAGLIAIVLLISVTRASW